MSRCRVLEFSSYGMAKDIVDLLAGVWAREGASGETPNFARLAKDSLNNVRDALMKLELEIMAA